MDGPQMVAANTPPTNTDMPWARLPCSVCSATQAWAAMKISP